MQLLPRIKRLSTRANIIAVLALLGLAGVTISPAATDALVVVIPALLDVLDAAT